MAVHFFTWNSGVFVLRGLFLKYFQRIGAAHDLYTPNVCPFEVLLIAAKSLKRMELEFFLGGGTGRVLLSCNTIFKDQGTYTEIFAPVVFSKYNCLLLLLFLVNLIQTT